MKTENDLTMMKVSTADKLIKELQSGYPIRDKKGIMTGIRTADGRHEVTISNWQHKVLAVFEKVRFRTPQINGKYLRFVEEKISIFRNGQVSLIPPYWRYGVIVGKEKKIVTRAYKVDGDPKFTKTGITFGEEVVGEIRICKSRNSLTGEVKIIVDHYVYLSPSTASFEVKIGGKKRDNTVFSQPVPGTNEFVVVNKIGK